MQNPKNSDIMQAIINLAEDVSGVKTDVSGVKSDIKMLKADVSQVKTDVKYTNGKVAGLMEDKIRRDERTKVEKERVSVPVASTKEGNIVVQPPASYWKSKEELLNKLGWAVAIVASALAAFLGVKP